MCKPVIFQGTSIALDMYGCDYDIVNDKNTVQMLLIDTAKRHSMQMLNIYSDNYPDSKDYSFLMSCTGGHIFVHIFPELGFVSADIFTVMEAANPDQVVACLRKGFAPDKTKLTQVKRGDFGSIPDMKPRHRKQIKPIRRAKNAGAALKKLVLKPKSL